MSMPRVLRSVMEAMNPLRESSAATKYSPATPASSEVVLIRFKSSRRSQGHRGVLFYIGQVLIFFGVVF